MRCHHEAKPRRETGIGQEPAQDCGSDISAILKINIYRREPDISFWKSKEINNWEVDVEELSSLSPVHYTIIRKIIFALVSDKKIFSPILSLDSAKFSKRFIYLFILV